MLPGQKGTILVLLKLNEMNKSYIDRYWIPYRDFLDPADACTDFACENLGGKEGYIALIENLLNADETAKVFVQVYGLEEDGGEQFITADTLIIYSKLPLAEIERIFNVPEDIFPSDIGELTDFTEHDFVVDDDGSLIPAADLFNDTYSAYYCWWD